jgi:hypothetical protein
MIFGMQVSNGAIYVGGYAEKGFFKFRKEFIMIFSDPGSYIDRCFHN